MKIFKIYSLIIVLFLSLSLFNIAHADCNISDKSALKGKDLTGCNLQNADLYRTNLYRANLEGANLSEANLEGANLVDADLTGADLEGADLYRANLEGATWVDGRTCAKQSRGECL